MVSCLCLLQHLTGYHRCHSPYRGSLWTPRPPRPGMKVFQGPGRVTIRQHSCSSFRRVTRRQHPSSRAVEVYLLQTSLFHSPPSSHGIQAYRPAERSSSRRTLQSPKTEKAQLFTLTKQNHNVSCILYKPQRLRISNRPPSTPKQPPYSVRGMIPETLQNLPGKTATIPVPTDLVKLKISQISQISQSLHRFTTSPKSSSLR